jgi:hypothetical protein
MLVPNAPSDQSASIRPISFVLDDRGKLSQPVTLAIRPQDLTRSESSRATVNQTLGRQVSGWLDNFGEALPSVTLSGHTGWREIAGTGQDGLQHFGALNDLVQHQYHAAKQSAIDSGLDPAGVKLLFVDMLDDFAWSVVPMQFVLRRNKQSPLLYQYNIVLQAISTEVDTPVITLPFTGDPSIGVRSLGSALSRLSGYQSSIAGLVNAALSPVSSVLGSVSAAASAYVGMALNALSMVAGVVQGSNNLATASANQFIGVASDLAQVGTVAFRVLASTAGMSNDLQWQLSSVASAFNEVSCIFRNSLRTRTIYQDFDGLYGASNCSSTTGGRPESAYAGVNPFLLLRTDNSIATLNSAALNGIASINLSDPVLAPLAPAEIGRHLADIVGGVKF